MKLKAHNLYLNKHEKTKFDSIKVKYLVINLANSVKRNSAENDVQLQIQNKGNLRELHHVYVLENSIKRLELYKIFY